MNTQLHTTAVLAFWLVFFGASGAFAQDDGDVDEPVLSDSEVLEEIQEIPTEQRTAVREEQLEEARQIEAFRVVDVELHCDLPQCDDDAFVDGMHDVIGIEPGDIVDGPRIARAVRRLARTQYFKEIQFDVRDGVLRWELAGATVIRRVRVKAGLALSTRIERRISFRSGGIWSGDPEVIELQRRSIRDYFKRDGFYGTTVAIDVKQVSEFVVDIEITIDRGTRMAIQRVYIRGHHAFSYQEIYDTILGQFNFLRGYTSRAFADAADAVIRKYRDAGFLEARIVATEEDVDVAAGTVDLYLEIDEGKRWELFVNGNRRFTSSRIIDASGLLDAGFVDATELKAAERRVEELYETRGYFFADVTIERRTVEDQLESLSIAVREGNIAEIRAIRFEGNEAMTDLELRELMTTSEYDLVTRGGYLQRARLDSEIEKIVQAYRVRGYPWARVERTVFVAENDGQELYVNLFIREGPRVNVRRVTISEIDADEGDGGSRRRVADTDDVREKLKLDEGASYRRELLEDDRATIERAWRARGAASVEVTTTCTARGSELDGCRFTTPSNTCTRSLVDDAATACTRTNFGSRTVEECLLADTSSVCATPVFKPEITIDHHVAVRETTRIGHIFVRGAFQSRDWVIISEIPMLEECEPERRRISLRTSGFEPPETCVFDRGILLQGQSNIRALGLYDSVRMEVIGPDQDTAVATVVISVEETSTRFVEYRIGVDSRPTGENNNQFRSTNELSYRDINFLGRGEELRLVGAFDLALTNERLVRNGEFDAELRAIYFDPRFYLFGALKKPWEARLELAYDYELLPVAPAPQTKTISLEAAIRDSIRKFRGIFFEVGLNLRRVETRDQSDDALSDDFEPSFILSIKPRVTIERRDNPLNPTRGYFGEVAMEIADDFLGFLNSERFTTVTTRHSVYLPLGPFVFAVNGRAGIGFGGILNGFRREGDLSLPLSERFFLGGISSVRGVPQNGLDSHGTDEPGGDVFYNGNVELRYPLIPSLSVYGAVFLDAGQLAADVSDLSLDGTMLTGGLGLRWLIADIVPLVLDYGVILNRQVGDEFGRLHFNIGYTF